MLRPEDQFEMADGSRPEPSLFDDALARTLPLDAFALLERGDVFESARGTKPPESGRPSALAYVSASVRLHAHGADAQAQSFVTAECVRVLQGNPMLSKRLARAKPIDVDLIPPGQQMTRYGYPAGISARAAGLFWNHPSWPAARLALRQDKLSTEKALVVHELAHAIQSLAFTQREQDLLYGAMLRTYRSKAAVDEVFAIYSEREFLDEGFDARDQRAPGVYGVARQRWSEEHAFTRFVRFLYHPHRPLAGSPRQ